MPGGSCTSICRVERSDGLVPDLVLQFGIAQHLHRRDAALRNDGVDGGRRHRLDRIQRLVVGAAGKIGIDAEFLHRHRCCGREPFFELAVEIAAGIALARAERLRAPCAASCSSIIRGTDW